MSLPLITLDDISLLLAVSAVLLLVTAEFVPYIFGDKTIVSDIKKLRYLALALGIMFIVTVAFRIFELISNLQP